MSVDYRYRKRPLEIEAFQMTKARREDNSDWPEWLNMAWSLEPGSDGSLSPQDYPKSHGTDMLVIETLEGTHLVSWGDFIIRGVHGELYPCKPDIFRETYEPVGHECQDGS